VMLKRSSAGRPNYVQLLLNIMVSIFNFYLNLVSSTLLLSHRPSERADGPDGEHFPQCDIGCEP
jgi:hypothetical protein